MPVSVYRDLLEQSCDCILVVNAFGVIELVSDGLLKTTGYSRDELIGQPPEILVPEKFFDHAQLRQGFVASPESCQTGEEKELTVRCKDGSEIPAEISLNSLETEDGSLVMVTIVDVTERKQIGDQLREGEKQLIEVQKMFHVGYWILDFDTGLARWSDEVYNIYGISREDTPVITRDQIKAFVHPDDRERVYENHNWAIDSGGPAYVEHRIVRPDQTVRTVSSRRQIIKDKHGNVTALAGTVHDITERKQAEQALLESERQLTGITDACPGAVFKFSLRPDGVQEMLFVSRGIQELLGITAEEGRRVEKIFERIVPDDLAPFQDEILASAKTLSPFNHEVRVQTPDGELKWIHMSSMPEPQSDGAVIWNGQMLDITDRKEAENALRKSEGQLREAHRIARMGTYDWDINKNLVSFSDEIFEIYGLKKIDFEWPHNVAFRLVQEMEHPDDQFTIQEKRDDTLKNGAPYDIEHRIVRQDGDVRHVQIRGKAIFDANGEAVRATGIIIDITERKQAEQEREELEQQLFQAQKMEAMGQLTGGMAHDFNNILQAILGFTSLSELVAEQTKNDKLAIYLEHIRVAGERAEQVVAQMLAYAQNIRHDASCQPLQPLVGNVLRLLGPTLPSTIVLATTFDEEPNVAEVDPVQFEQMLLNLCINARDAMAGYGTIKISLSETSLDQEFCEACQSTVSGDFICLSVSDSGTGIPEEIRSRIFDPFYTTKGVGEGSGLGLSMIHGIMHNCDGHIMLTSVQGEGSDFRLMFPLVSGDIASANVPDINREPRASERNSRHGVVMVVDDEVLVADALSGILQAHGYEVVLHTSAETALDAIRAAPEEIDLVVTDQTMPGLTGLRLAEAILQVRPEMPIILLTGYSKEVNEELALQVGITAFYQKPVDAQLLLKTVHESLEPAS